MSRAAPLRIAGVDGDRVTRELLALCLEPLGVSLHLEASVGAALQALKQQPADAFFLAEAALADAADGERRALRERLAALPVAMLMEPGEEPAWSADWPMVQARLGKPVSVDAVLHLCRQWSGEEAPESDADPLAGLVALAAETGMDDALVRELMESFLERMPEYLGEARQALDAHDRERLRRTLHSVKGMCANLRLDGLARLSDGLRDAATGGDRCAADAADDALRAEFERVAAAIAGRRPADG